MHWLGVLNVSSNSLCGKIPTGTQFSTFNVTSFQRNKCLSGCPLDTCIEKRKEKGEDIGNITRNNVQMGWLNRVDGKMSLIALGIGMGIGFGGVVLFFILCKRARCWMVPQTKPQLFYGVYRFPK